MWSMSAGVRGEELKTLSNYYTPGPGNYDQVQPEITKDAYPSWKVGTGRRPNLYGSSNADVGPGSYETNKNRSDKKHDKKTFSRDKRGHSEFKGMSTVGPDAYHPKRNGKAPAAFSFGYKTDGFAAAFKSDVPGPGAYEIKDGIQPEEEDEKRRTAFNRTAPQELTKSRQPMFGPGDLPGPGTHFDGEGNEQKDNFDYRYFTPTWSFGKANRDDLYNETKHVPGPGKYQVSGTINSKTGFTMLGRYDVKGNTGSVPGPNVYNQDIQPLRKTAPAFRIGKAERKDMSTGTPEFPGPGAYYANGIGRGKTAKIGTSRRPGLYSQEAGRNPGPGAYEVRGNIAKGIKYSMGIKGGAKKIGEVYPGPGEYEPFGSVYLDKNIGAIIGTSERPALYKKGMAPGPGQYDVRGDVGDAGTKSKIGNGKRQPMSKVNDEPGPGYYNIPSAIANVQKYLWPYFPEEKRRANMDKEETFRGIFVKDDDE